MNQDNQPSGTIHRNWQRLPLMVFALLALIAGLWAGLLRLGWQIPTLTPRLLVEHGSLMVSGFLGTLISLERVVALSHLQPRARLYYLSPFLVGLGTIALFFPGPQAIPRILIALGAAGFLLIHGVIYRMQPSTHIAVMGLGALLWLFGDVLWLAGLPVFRIVPWWAAFLVLTIAGERLELARLIALTLAARMLFLVITGIVLVGLAVSLAAFDIGMRIAGLGLAALGLWLLRYDIARRTIRQKKLPRFIAACLLPGYFWLFLGGLFWLAYGGSYPAGPIYDAMLHTIFLGFVFSMIFGHAPIIIPALMGVPINFSPVYYIHLGLLHFSLALRVLSDLIMWHPMRQWSGILNEIALVWFLMATFVFALRANDHIKFSSASIRNP